MNILIVSGSPKQPGEGLCQSLIQKARLGIEEAGGSALVLEFSALTRCRVCGGGWGTCLDRHTCAFGDDGFDAAQRAVREAEGLVLITPVYFGEMAESLKAFTDRLRRCEFQGQAATRGKPALLVASAGGSGNGINSCLTQMERFCQHTGIRVFDMVGVNRWNQAYKRESIRQAAGAMALSLKGR